mmetsp:Transcript_41705/g.100411  ORF Transcript_41705/g.100411 Transcript_41705/m.100411 type:complete len:95 (+) Transcript_41705:162-446(+)
MIGASFSSQHPAEDKLRYGISNQRNIQYVSHPPGGLRLHRPHFPHSLHYILISFINMIGASFSSQHPAEDHQVLFNCIDPIPPTVYGLQYIPDK